MPPIDPLEKLLFGLASLCLMWAGRLFGKWVDARTKDRRAEVDKRAKAETRARLLTESLHEHRNLMLESGLWTRETLPDFIQVVKEVD